MTLFQRLRPFSLRARFLLATAAIVLFLSLSYGMVAVVGYVVSFDKNTYRVMRGESNLFFTLAQWQDNKLTIAQPERMTLNFPTLVFIYDEHGKLQKNPPRMAAQTRLLRNRHQQSHQHDGDGQ
jgi:two-component system sensor histidine kinase PhoQ